MSSITYNNNSYTCINTAGTEFLSANGLVTKHLPSDTAFGFRDSSTRQTFVLTNLGNTGYHQLGNRFEQPAAYQASGTQLTADDTKQNVGANVMSFMAHSQVSRYKAICFVGRGSRRIFVSWWRDELASFPFYTASGEEGKWSIVEDLGPVGGADNRRYVFVNLDTIVGHTHIDDLQYGDDYDMTNADFHATTDYSFSFPDDLDDLDVTKPFFAMGTVVWTGWPGIWIRHREEGETIYHWKYERNPRAQQFTREIPTLFVGDPSGSITLSDSNATIHSRTASATWDETIAGRFRTQGSISFDYLLLEDPQLQPLSIQVDGGSMGVVGKLN